MRLIERQWEFAELAPKLLNKAFELGYLVTFGDAYRDPRCTYGHPQSNHKKRLAIDLNLFKDGKYITNDEGHRELHEYWESIGGAPMIPNDPNHYSMEWQGII